MGLKKMFLLLAAALMVLLVICDGAAWACPTCKEGLAENDPARAGMVRGYFWSILFMMSMPFLILAGLGSYIYLHIRRADASRVPAAGRTALAARSASFDDTGAELESAVSV